MKKIIIHPFLLAIFPILTLYKSNINNLPASSIIEPLAISIYGSIIAFALIYFFAKSILKTSILTSLLIIFYFTFTHFTYSNFIFNAIFKNSMILYYLLALIWIFIYYLLFKIILAVKLPPYSVNLFLNILSAALIIMTSAEIIIFFHKNNYTFAKTVDAELTMPAEENEQLPDIYYIILDAYAREDVLKEYYNYDNSEFINFLKEKGFYVAEKSMTNYGRTHFSISSSLNYQHHLSLSKKMKNSYNLSPLIDLIHNNKVYNYLRGKGYKIVSMPSAWYGDNGNNADIFLAEEKKIFKSPLNYYLMPNFLHSYKYLNKYRSKILYNFEHLPDIAKINGPTFNYSHIIIPHPPFVFNKNGEEINPEYTANNDGIFYFKLYPDKEDYKNKYKDTIIFINSELKKTINNIIDNSDSPPIIIIQSDHGPGLNLNGNNIKTSDPRERISILNAYFVPKEIKEKLYDKITPINTFPIIFNSLFNDSIKLNEDKSYMMGDKNPYLFYEANEYPDFTNE